MVAAQRRIATGRRRHDDGLVLRSDLLQFKRYHEAEVRIAGLQQRVTAPEGGRSAARSSPAARTGKTTRGRDAARAYRARRRPASRWPRPPARPPPD
jgi:hypothetical protein